MAKHKSTQRKQPQPRKKTAQLPTKAQEDSAIVRQHHRKTKPPGLVTREKELVERQRELSTVRGTGVATKVQVRRLQTAVDSAQRGLKRQQDAARRAGRPVK